MDESNAASSHEPPPAVPGQAAPPPPPAQPAAAAIAQRAPPVRRALFNGPATNHQHHAPVRRTKSEGHVQGESAVPEVCTDATMNDRLWSKLEDPNNPGGNSSHRDSVSSSSSISSNDTVIDLSLPNLVRKGLPPMGGSVGGEAPWSRPRSALVSYDAPRAVSKSKSNPNLRQGQSPPATSDDELQSRPLGALPRRGGGEDASPGSTPGRTAQRRHTWSRLYMEGLKQASNSSSSPRRGPSSVAPSPSSSSSMSKSLGDLTSDDIACNFDSKYRSISRSFIVRPTREQLRRGSLGGRSTATGQQQQRSACSDLTEQLRRLTDVEPLTASDFSSSSSSSSSSPRTAPEQEEEAVVDEPPLRRTSSRSQSRVRYIANRAKQAQERQRLQMGLHLMACQRNVNGSISRGGSGSPIEERGNPEGACCVARSPCSSLDLLSQLAPQSVGSLSSPHHHHQQQQVQTQSSPDPKNNEVFFMLKL